MDYLSFSEHERICRLALERAMPKLKEKYGMNFRDLDVTNLIRDDIWQKCTRLQKEASGESLIDKLSEVIPIIYDEVSSWHSNIGYYECIADDEIPDQTDPGPYPD